MGVKLSQTNKWSRDQAIDLPNYVVHVYQSIYEEEKKRKKIEVTLFYRLQWELQWEWCQKTKYLKKSLSDGILAKLRPLYNNNVAKVSIVKWPQSGIFVVESVISGIPNILKNLGFQCNFKIMG